VLGPWSSTTMDIDEEIRKAREAHDAAWAVVRKATPGKAGFGIEAVYGQTYQYLVRLGVKPQLKKKYR
jgi:hypothetical protein